MSKQIYFRVDSNYDIGNGHLARCINLANIIKKIGYKAIFITKYRNKNTIKFERKFNFVYINKFKNINSEITSIDKLLKKNFRNYIFIDSYLQKLKWFIKINKIFDKVIVIDDIAKKKIISDIIINQNIGFTKLNYSKISSIKTKFFFGPKYNLISNDVYKLKKESKKLRKNYSINSIGISFGSSDNLNYTDKILKIINKNNFFKNYTINIYLGPNYKHSKKIILKNHINKNFKFFINHKNYLKSLIVNDLVIGSPGVSIIERFILGIPSIVINDSYNQEVVSNYLISKDLIKILDKNDIENSLISHFIYFNNRENYKKYHKKIVNLYKEKYSLQMIKSIVS